MPSVNWLAVIIAAIAMFGLGAVWYSPVLFLNQWVKAAGLEIDYAKRGNFALILGTSFALTLVLAILLAFFIAGPAVSLGFALAASLAAGLGFATISMGIIALFERRPAAYMAINGGYITAGFLLMGLILGLWR